MRKTLPFFYIKVNNVIFVYCLDMTYPGFDPTSPSEKLNRNCYKEVYSSDIQCSETAKENNLRCSKIPEFREMLQKHWKIN